MRELLGPVHLARNSDFFLAGGDSLLAVRLAARLGDVFGVQPSRADVIKARTPVRIAALMDGRVGSNGAAKAPNGNGPSAAEPDGCVVRLSRGDERLAPIVLIHAIGGGAFIYRELLESLAHPYPAYGLQAPGLWDDAAPLSSVRAQAELYYASLLRAGVQRPVLVGGCSYGGLVAYELDRLYRAAGHAPVVALFDSPGPGRMPERLDGEAAICAYLLSGDSRNGEYEAQVAELRRLDRPGRVARLRDRLRQTHLPQASNDDVERLLRVFRQNLDNLWNWTPAVHDTRLVFFKATEQARQVARNPELAWIPLAPLGIEILPVPGDHSSMLSRPHVRRIAAELDRILPPPRRADARITHERVSLTL
jgi:thioesterase domain-containing protein